MNYLFLFRMIKTSVGRKQLMAVTGLLIASFLFIHLAGNLLLFKGEDWYNGWSEVLIANPLTIYIEIGLLFLFIIHITMAVWVRTEDLINASYRKYDMSRWHGGRTIGSATMLYTAIIILVYLLFHLIHFRFADKSVGVYQMVVSAFRSPLFVSIYIIGSVALAIHLSHGFQSAFQTLGINHIKYNIYIKIAGYLVAVCMALFAAISLYFYFGLDLRQIADVSNIVEMTIE